MTRRPSQSGFTLLELVVVMGLLAGFLVFLTQLLSGSVELFDEGETGQELADLGNAAAVAARDAVSDMAGPEQETYEAGEPDARLFAEWVPLGLVPVKEGVTYVQAVRATVRVAESLELGLLRERLRAEAEEMPGGRSEDEIAERLQTLVGETSRRGRGDMLLLPWPAGDEEGAFLELRRAILLEDDKIALGRRQEIGLREVDSVAALPREIVVGMTESIAQGLLHVEFAFESQNTKSFAAPPGGGGPEMVWDSARAGLLVGEDPARSFSLDRESDSYTDTTDDVFPRSVQVVVVVARQGREARLAESLTREQTRLVVDNPGLLVGLSDTSFVKVGTEWVRYGGQSGRALTGLVRGRRGTAAVTHEPGTAVRIGKTIRLTVDLPHGRDSWND